MIINALMDLRDQSKMFYIMLLVLLFVCISSSIADEQDLKVVTVATDETDGYKRFMHSAQLFNLDVDVYGLREEWLGGDMSRGPGGGHKINILRNNLKKYKDNKNLLLMFTDSYDVVFASGKDEIIEKFKKSGADVLISAEDFVWPDRSLASKYPLLKQDGYRYLCSGGIIGYAPAVYNLLTLKSVNHTDDDQLYYTHIYLDSRDRFNIKLDHTANLFQNLNGNRKHIELKFGDDNDVRVVNTRFNTIPSVIHGNGPSKLFLNHLANYVPKAWNHQSGCQVCNDDTIKLSHTPQSEWPHVVIGLFVPTVSPFLDLFLEHIANLDYPKTQISIFIHNVDVFHSADVDVWIQKYTGQYRSITLKSHAEFLSESEARNMGIFHSQKLKSDYYFSVDSSVTISNKQTLQLLIEQNRTILAPMVSKYEKYWSNFWGDVSYDGYYARSPDYLDLVRKVRMGVWNSPFIAAIYLINSTVIDKIGMNPFTGLTDFDIDVNFCAGLREKGLFMHVTNLEYFGHMKEMDNFTTGYKHNDMFQLFNNKLDWEEKYLHPDWAKYTNPNTNFTEACPDVFWVPVVTEKFASDLIEECEHFGQWSGGKNEDKRLAGGYENVPTVDIHMNQIGFEAHWLQMLKDYFTPIITTIFTGYTTDAQSHMNFVVKYTLSGQFLLRPHHDASTYTVNLALNRPGVDYEGGGARFIRYDCSVKDTKVGWALLHPGRLTHQHEGLPITKGTRYIMISFVDP